jgi:hypothetical protein
MSKSNNTFPPVSKELVDYLKTKVSKVQYRLGDSIKPETIAFIYGQQDMYEQVLALYNRSTGNGRTILNAKVVHAPGGNPGGDQEESLFGSTEI